MPLPPQGRFTNRPQTRPLKTHFSFLLRKEKRFLDSKEKDAFQSIPPCASPSALSAFTLFRLALPACVTDTGPGHGLGAGPYGVNRPGPSPVLSLRA